ncbi:MAG: 6,7-dimethyl-8-ribityllumazine synthase [Rhodospirillales bacterium]|jgi:6,7-dimethyl-8-ribityllumazine synthase
MNHTKNPKIAFIKTCWHSKIVSRCQDGFMAEFDHRGWSTDGVEIIEVPGALEIPLLAKKLSKTGTFEAIIAAGLVVDGGIYRHDFVATAVIDGLMQVQLETDIPIISAVLTPHQFHEHETHLNFFGEHFVTKGVETANACIQVLENFKRFEV